MRLHDARGANGKRVSWARRSDSSTDRETKTGTAATASAPVRLQELIREEVNLILRNEVRDPRLDGVVITMVELAGDGSCARLWFTAEGDDDKREACEHIAGFSAHAARREPRIEANAGAALPARPRVADVRPRRDGELTMPSTTIKGRNVPIQLWAPLEEVDSEVITQLKNVAALPWVAHHVAVMPDVHLGKGATVGSVIAMHGAVAPAAVGVDIGCGMAAVKTSLTSKDLPDDLRRLRLDDRGRDPGRPDVARRGGLAARARRAARHGPGADGPLRDARRARADRDRSPARWERWAAATTSSRSASTPTTRSG